MVGVAIPKVLHSDFLVMASKSNHGSGGFGRGGGFLLRRLMAKTIGMAIAAGMPTKTARISAMTMRSGPISFAKLAIKVLTI